MLVCNTELSFNIQPELIVEMQDASESTPLLPQNTVQSRFRSLIYKSRNNLQTFFRNLSTAQRIIFALVVVWVFLISLFIIGLRLIKHVDGPGNIPDETDDNSLESFLGKLPNITCLDKRCVLYAADIVNNMDEAIDPCEVSVFIIRESIFDLSFDVYRTFIDTVGVGGYLTDVETSKRKPHSSIITSSIHRMLLNEKPPVDDSLTTKEQELDKVNFHQLQSLFNLCTKSTSQLSTLRQFLSEYTVSANYALGVAVFPSTHKNLKIANLSTAIGVSHSLGGMLSVNSFFQWDIVPESRFGDRERLNVVRISAGGLMLQPDEFTKETSVDLLLKTISDALKLLNLKNVNFIGKNLERRGIESTAKTLVTIEKRLASKMVANVSNFEMSRDNLVVSIKELQNMFPNLNWTIYLETLLRKSVGPEMKVVVKGKRYFMGLNELIGQMEVDEFELYFVWKLALQHLISFDQELHTSFLKLSRLNSRFIEPSRGETCIGFIDKYLPDVLLSFHIRNSFVKSFIKDEEQTKQLEYIYNNISQTFQQQITTDFPWMDETTSEYAHQKISSIKPHYFGNLEVLKPASIASRIAIFFELPQDIFSMQRDIMEDHTYSQITMHENVVDSQEWPFSLLSPFANEVSFIPSLNALYLPLGFLHRMGVFTTSYLDYAAFGSNIASTMALSILDHGRLYDIRGEHLSWYTKATLSTYREYLRQIRNNYTAFISDLELIDAIRWNNAIRYAVRTWEREVFRSGKQFIRVDESYRSAQEIYLYGRLPIFESYWDWRKLMYLVTVQKECQNGMIGSDAESDSLRFVPMTEKESSFKKYFQCEL
ncbi:18S rRNA pseudouridine methyltransferase [Nowakowskiella sp. JEL0407]|nr:18S rRNA pseudouridine methyltransferase [Nowakowskiella sp. JEL0407]